MATKPPNVRPYRAQHEPGTEVSALVGDWRQTLRQVGWQGQTGAFYSLDEDPSPFEPGSFSPLWVVAHSDDARFDDRTDSPLDEQQRAGAAVLAERLREELERVRDAHEQRGLFQGALAYSGALASLETALLDLGIEEDGQ